MEQNIWFGKYRIVKLLGIGGTAKVYLAEHIKLKSYRVIKSISKNHPLYDKHLKEALILKSLKHSCIPIVYDIEEDRECSYIIEQYLEGITLKDYVKNNIGIREDIIIQFAIQICDLIHYLHTTERPLLYLDLKPENILVTDNTIKLIDFGSAIYQDEIEENTYYSATRGYAAPELYKHGKVKEQSDIYGIGMLLYYMVTGVQFNSRSSSFTNIDFQGKCSNSLKDIINRCLKYHPVGRYKSVLQLSEKLKAIERSGSYRMKWRRNKIRDYRKTGQQKKIAIAGSQPRIGVTHIAFSLSTYFIGQNYKCLYEERNSSQCVWSIKCRYDGLTDNEGVYIINGIPMVANQKLIKGVDSDYDIRVQDFGCLTMDCLEEFLEADIKIIVLGAKDWELTHSEHMIEMVAEDKEIIYLFNFMDGKQYRTAIKSMDQLNCYRIPYNPNPFIRHINDYEIFKEIARLCLKFN